MKIKIAATQMSCGWKIEENISKAKILIDQAAKKGANIILLQELFQTPYFCIQYDEKIFRLAQPYENNKIINFKYECGNFFKLYRFGFQSIAFKLLP